MTLVFVGWDVGAWHCDSPARSQDALVALAGSSLSDLHLVGTLWRGNLRQRMSSLRPDAAFLDLLKVQANAVVWAIDAPLGWPEEFRDLAFTHKLPTSPPRAAKDDRIIYRTTERWLCSKGFKLPLSGLQDQIGSQATKAQFFLKAAQLRTAGIGWWTKGGADAIEAYPSVTRRSRALSSSFRRVSQDTRFKSKTSSSAKARSDYRDALWCAMVAAAWRLDRELLRHPQDVGAFGKVPESEGWIWCPRDAKRPTRRSSRQRQARKA